MQNAPKSYEYVSKQAKRARKAGQPHRKISSACMRLNGRRCAWLAMAAATTRQRRRRGPEGSLTTSGGSSGQRTISTAPTPRTRAQNSTWRLIASSLLRKVDTDASPTAQTSVHHQAHTWCGPACSAHDQATPRGCRRQTARIGSAPQRQNRSDLHQGNHASKYTGGPTCTGADWVGLRQQPCMRGSPCSQATAQAHTVRRSTPGARPAGRHEHPPGRHLCKKRNRADMCATRSKTRLLC